MTQTEQALDELADLLESGGLSGGQTRGQVRAFLFDATHQRIVWQPEVAIVIRSLRKCPGSSIDLVVSTNDLTKIALLSMQAGQAPLHQVLYYDGEGVVADGAAGMIVAGMNVWIEPDKGDKVYFNWLTTTFGIVFVYFDYVGLKA